MRKSCHFVVLVLVTATNQHALFRRGAGNVGYLITRRSRSAIKSFLEAARTIGEIFRHIICATAVHGELINLSEVFPGDNSVRCIPDQSQ